MDRRGAFLLPSHIDCGVCLLRPWTWADKASLVRHADNRQVWRNLRDLFPHPYTEADAESWLARVAAVPPPEGIYAIEVGGQAAGTIAMHRREDVERLSAEVGYWLGEPYWGRGIVTAALRALTDAAFRDTDLIRLFAPVFAWNPASMRALEKAGYRREAVLVKSAVKDGVVIDQVIYAVTRDPDGPYTPAGEIHVEDRQPLV
jgi:ribosomal-protein-alanine N-acetyltransferase